jgi:hypothetical protein
MKKVINGKVYNTDTAECLFLTKSRDVFEKPSNGPHREFEPGHWTTYSLFKTKAGAYFLYTMNEGENAPQINGLCYENAKKWAKLNMDEEKYKKYFCGEKQQGKSRIELYLSNNNIAKLEMLKSKTGKSISQIIDGMVLELEA